MCRTLGVTPSGYYAWCGREPSARTKSDAELTQKIQVIHDESRSTYGVPRVHAMLAADGIGVGKKRVARLMKAAGLEGVSRRKKYRSTRNKDARPAPDLVEREFVASAVNQLWVADITYVPTWAGFLYLAVVLDVFSRRIVGWAMETHLRTELVVSALDMAVGQRQPTTVIHHSDQGCQGEFKRSSQHLPMRGMDGWLIRSEYDRHGQDEHRFALLGARQFLDESTDRFSGLGSLAG
jgi:putative transposase